MKITHIETIALRDPGRYGETIVRVHTDEGLSGIGQAESPSLVIDAILHCQTAFGARILPRSSGCGKRCTTTPASMGGGG